LPPGTRLPSLSRLAEYLKTSQHTVQTAYERLIKEGLLDSRMGKGTWVKSGQVVDAAAVLRAAPLPGLEGLYEEVESGSKQIALPWRLADVLRRRMEDGSLPPGTRLPSLSRLAEYLGISSGTVQTAYGQLVGEGLLDIGMGVGTWVKSGQVVDAAAVSGSAPAAGLVRPEAGRGVGGGTVRGV